MTHYDVTYSPAALDDLRSIFSYIAFTLRERSTATKQVERIRKAIRSLDVFPKRNPKVDWEPWASMEMHKLVVNRYVVFYLAEEETRMVTVVRIVYGGRDIEGMIREEYGLD